MAAAGIASLDGDLVIVSERTTGAGRRADAELLARFAQAQARRLRRAAYLNFVPATVVNLGPGRNRSEEKETEWAQVAGTDYLPDALGPNQTWRRRYVRGTGIDPAIAAQLDRAREAIVDLGGGADVTSVLDNAVADPFETDTDQPGTGTPPGTAVPTDAPPGEQR
jgi:hypothetical protein